MTVIANVTLRFINDFMFMTILTVTMGGLIMTGGMLGTEEGANFLRIETEGWAKDQHIAEGRIYDAFDLRVPQVETGALFLATNIFKSPEQVRYTDAKRLDVALCAGSHKNEACSTGIDCDYPSYSRNGFIGDETSCDELSKHCMIQAWCNIYRWFCVSNGKVYAENVECDAMCPQCMSSVLVNFRGEETCGNIVTREDNGKGTEAKYVCEHIDGKPHRCFNRYKTDFRQAERCVPLYLSTNASLNPSTSQFIMEGVQDWVIKFDIFMRFSKYWQDRNVVDEYYAEVNVWTVDRMLKIVGAEWEKVRETGIIIAVNGNIECTLFSPRCDITWQISRVDEKNAGFEMTHMIYTPGVSLLFAEGSSRETRHIIRMKGIRIIANISSKLYSPEPMAAVLALGGIMGLLGLSREITNFLMTKLDPKHKVYNNFMEVDYETLVKQEKSQIKKAFDEAITKHMKALYAEEQAMKDMLGIVDGASDKEDRF